MGTALLTFIVAAALSGKPSARQRVADAARLETAAEAETNSGDYAAAIRDATEAAAIYAENRDVQRRGSATNLVGLAQLYRGDYAAAQQSFNHAIALATTAHDDAVRAEATTNRGNAEYFVGRYADASDDYDAALRLTTLHGSEEWSAHRRRIVLVNQATLDQKLGRDEQALTTYREVQSGPGLRPREQAQLLVNLGVLYRRLGDPIKALATYDAALALFSREHLLDGELGVMKNRGIVLALDLNRLNDAQANFTDALDRATRAANHREMLQAQLYRGETELRRGDIENARVDFAASRTAAQSLKTPEEEWKAWFGMGRVKLRSGDRDGAAQDLLRAVAIIEHIRETIRVPALRSDFFNDKREVYDALIDLDLERGDALTVFELLERSHSRAWRDRLGLTTPLTFDAVRHVLPAGVLLIDTWSSPQGSAVVSVSRDSLDVRRVHLDDATLRSLVDALSSPGGASRSAAAAAGAQLLPRVIPPAIDHVIVIADRALTLIPFEVLPFDRGMLIERVAVSYAPTAAILFRPRKAATRFGAPWTLELTAFGDPAFGSTKLDDAAAARMRLAASADEVHAIARDLGGRSVLHLGADDQKAILLKPASTPLLHIASHAVADVNAIEQSRILFSPANTGGSTDYLFLREAYDLPLEGVDLAVLSACDTERGPLPRGEGVQSFSRAFLAAGARSTVTTMWRVPDRATAAFMTVFYHHLQRGMSKAEALRTAKLRFLQSGSAIADPHYWAAFVLTGDGIHPIPTALRWSSVVLAGVAALLVALAVWLIIGRH